MIIDGKMIAKEIEMELKHVVDDFSIRPTLAIVIVGENPVIENFVRMKKSVGERIGVLVALHRFPKETPSAKLVREVSLIGADPAVQGMIVQLPLHRAGYLLQFF